jgi:hypothetical protein
LLTPIIIKNKLVAAEIDAGFVRKVEGECKFVPLRFELAPTQLPSLLRALYSPAITNFEADIAALIDAIHGITSKPALGPAPYSVARWPSGSSSLSPAADLLVKEMIARSESGYSMDPQLDRDKIRSITSLSDNSIVDAVDELESLGLIEKYVTIGCGEIGFAFIAPTDRLFSEFDQYFRPWNPKDDAKQIAADLVNGVDGSVPSLAAAYKWAPRRMNPAISYLKARDLVEFSRSIGMHPWSCSWIRKTHATRRWVQLQV